MFGVSGYSGAGTKKGTQPKVSPEELQGSIRPYSLTDHIHEREASYHLSKLRINHDDDHRNSTQNFRVGFIPSVGPWFSGIIATASIPLQKKLNANELHQAYESKYKDEKLLTWTRQGIPSVMEIQNRHGWIGGGLQVSSHSDRVVVVGVLDNLLKGAATQCLQNLNLALGFDEFDGIPL